MLISLKDAFKLVGITVVAFCAVFVCTFFLNFYLDAKALEGTLTDAVVISLYNAQMATARFTCAVSGGFLGLIAVVMLVFYVKLYADGHAEQLGILKALGYSDIQLALRFWVFGLSVLLGAAAGFAGGFMLMPAVYRSLTVNGLPEIAITFHLRLLILLVAAPSALYSALACVCALFVLKRPVCETLRGKSERVKPDKNKGREKDGAFLKTMCFKTVSSKKQLAFFVAFACFCFSAMVQMSASMYGLSTHTMGVIIFVIGVVLAVVTVFMALTALINANVKNIAIMKAFGYSVKECALSVLGGYHIFAVLGFAAGTAYQYGLLSLMVNVVYKDVGVPEYGFNIPVFFITLAAFTVFYEAVTLFFVLKMNKISVRRVMGEN